MALKQKKLEQLTFLVFKKQFLFINIKKICFKTRRVEAGPKSQGLVRLDLLCFKTSLQGSYLSILYIYNTLCSGAICIYLIPVR